MKNIYVCKIGKDDTISPHIRSCRLRSGEHSYAPVAVIVFSIEKLWNANHGCTKFTGTQYHEINAL